MACEMPKPCKFPSVDSCQKFLWTHKEVEFAPHPVDGAEQDHQCIVTKKTVSGPSVSK